MGELYASEPWEIVSIDFLTSLPSTARGNKHLLVCCDHFTRWVEVFPLPDMTATTVARVRTHELFSRFGCPKQLHSDCAANFRGELIAEVCRLLGVRKTSTTSFHPQGNSRCERMMKTVLEMLSKYLDDNHNEWDEHLPLLMLGYRSQVHKSLGFSPFFLMFGHEPRLPIDVEIDAPCSAKSTSETSYVDKLCAGLRTSYREAIRMSHNSNSKNKRLYEKRLNTFSYQVGDRVSLFKNVPKRGEYYKFVRPWKPAVIVSIHGELNYSVRLEDTGKILRAHHNRLKSRQYSEPAPRAPNRRTDSSKTDPPLGEGGVRAGQLDPSRRQSERGERPLMASEGAGLGEVSSAIMGSTLKPLSADAEPGVQTLRSASADPSVQIPSNAGDDPGVQAPRSSSADPIVQTQSNSGADRGVQTPDSAVADPCAQTPPSAGGDPGVQMPLGAEADPGVEVPRGAEADPGVEAQRGAEADPGVQVPRGVGAELSAAASAESAVGLRRTKRPRRTPAWYGISIVLLLRVIQWLAS